MSDETMLVIGVLFLSSSIFILPIILSGFSITFDNGECELKWVDCTDNDKIGDCEEQTEEIVSGPYWNKTTETKITFRKQVCKEDD